MPDTPLAMVSASLWDLRTQCEQQLRSLTDAQRIADQFRESAPDRREDLKLRLLADMQSVLRTNLVVREAAQDCLELVSTLPASPDGPQRT